MTGRSLELKLVAIQVECYAGAKADEKPRRFAVEGEDVQIAEVLDRWYQVESKPEWPELITSRFMPRTAVIIC
jgi:hypothetical protein